jgi:hypothetical protein
MLMKYCLFLVKESRLIVISIVTTCIITLSVTIKAMAQQNGSLTC